MSGSEKILVIGATSDAGGAVAHTLIGMGANVRLLEHKSPISQELKDTGVEIVSGDLLDPDSLHAAFEGADRVFSYTPIRPELAEMASNTLAAAKRAGASHILRLFEKSPEPASALRVGRLHIESDAELKASGVPFTLIKPTQYMQVMLFSAHTIAADGMIYAPYKDGKYSAVDIRDVAEAIAVTLTTEGHDGKSYVLTGPASISLHDVAAEFSKALDKNVTYVNVPMEAARASMQEMGLDDWFIGAFCEYMDNFSNGGGDMTSDDFEKLTGHPPRTFDVFARDFAPYFREA